MKLRWFTREERPRKDSRIEAKPTGDDSSVILNDSIIPGRMAKTGTVSAVGPDDEWFGPKRDARERKDMPRPAHPGQASPGQ